MLAVRRNATQLPRIALPVRAERNRTMDDALLLSTTSSSSVGVAPDKATSQSDTASLLQMFFRRDGARAVCDVCVA